jgi:hypothetical protein
MYIQSYLYIPKIYHIVGSDSKYSGKWQRRRVPFGFTDQNVAVYQDTNSQLCTLPPEILNDLYESSQQSGRKHKCTPLKGSTPKRKRLLSPGTPSRSSSISGSYDTVVVKFKKWRRRLVEIAREYTWRYYRARGTIWSDYTGHSRQTQLLFL